MSNKHLEINFLNYKLEEALKNPNSNLLINYEREAHFADIKQQSWTKKERENKIKIGELIKKQLFSKYSDRISLNNKKNDRANINLIFALFLNDIKTNSERIELKILDSISKKKYKDGSDKFQDYCEKFKENGSINNKKFLKNFVLIITLKDSFVKKEKWNKNSACLFFSVDWTNNDFIFEFTLNKISFINNNYSIIENGIYFNSIDFREKNSEKERINFPNLLAEMKNYFTKNNFSLNRSFETSKNLEIDTFIDLIQLFINKKEERISDFFLFNFNLYDSIWTEWKENDENKHKQIDNLYILSKNKLIEKNKLFTIQDYKSNAIYSNKYSISSSNFKEIKDKKSILDFANIEKKKFQDFIETKENEKNSLESELNKLTNDNISNSKEIEDKNLKIHQLEIEELNLELKIKEEIKKNKELAKNKNSNFKLANHYSEINNLTFKKEEIEKEIKKLTENKAFYENTKSKIEAQIKGKKDAINKLNQEIKKKGIEIQNLDAYLNFINREIVLNDNLNIYKVSLNCSDSNTSETEIIEFEPLYQMFLKLYSKDSRFNLDNVRKWYCDFTDIGFITKMNRFRNALFNVQDGYYRNPFIIHNLIEPEFIPDELIEKSKNELLESGLIKKYRLNEKQQRSIEKMDAVRDIAYLQGPPGTGKTQVISAFVEQQIKKFNNLLITSSTHEAIENALDRLDDLNKNNPTVILLKKTSNTRETKFSEDNIYNLFTEKMINNFSSNKDEKYLYELLINKNLNKSIINFELQPILKRDESELAKFWKNLNADDKYKMENFVTGWGAYSILNYEYKNRILISMNNQTNDLWEYNENLDAELEEFVKAKLKLLSEENQYFYTFESFLKAVKPKIENKNTNQEKEINSYIKSYLNNEEYKNISNEEEKLFLDFINDNNLINVIGMTTTSSTQFTINNNVRDILDNYPIDITIVDEVSKSSTPEILSRLIVSNKTILCGDYKQLPPNEDLSETVFSKKINDMFENNKFDEFKEKFFKFYSERNRKFLDHSLFEKLDIEKIITIILENDNQFSSQGSITPEKVMNSLYEIFSILKNNKEKRDKFIEKIFEKIKDIFNIPLFRKQVEYIKEKSHENSSKKPYEFLNEQYRCNKTIMNLINVFYENDEKLLYGSKKIDSQNEIKELRIFDTSVLSRKFVSLIKDKSIFKELDKKNEFISFDQEDWIDCFNGVNPPSLKSGGLFNQYNVYIISLIIKKMIDQKIDIVNKVGIICLTINQKKIAISILSKLIPNYSKYKIKVDTIDNFQGREKEIIIVDFVRSKNRLNQSPLIIKSIDNRNLTFLTQEERLNVAISRAKKELILVGAFKYYLDHFKNNSTNGNRYFNNPLTEYRKNKPLLERYIDHWTNGSERWKNTEINELKEIEKEYENN
ncbi:AAA domain-containing protein [Mycoplasmopsis gallinarum]